MGPKETFVDGHQIMGSQLLHSFLIVLAGAGVCLAEMPADLQRCEVLPEAGHQASFMIDGREKVRWHFDDRYPRPFFYPFNGPAGASLTRMGHPGAQNHDHHRSIWFAHNDVGGVNFWSEQTAARVRQKHWYSYRDGGAEAVLAVALGWCDGANHLLMDQDVVAALVPLPNDESALEIQTTFRVPAKGKEVVLGKTNFGFLAVRVAKTISDHFGGGKLTDSESRVGEPAIFGKSARWMDYSGTIAAGVGTGRKGVVEGITFFDHPTNPRHPTHWHVRADGWMGAAFNLDAAHTITTDTPLRLRYLLQAHQGSYDPAKAQSVQDAFARRPGFVISKATKPHRQFEVDRESSP